MIQLSLPFRIHIWGGLGSQLFALVYALRIQRERPGRQIHLVLHTDGITRREPDILRFKEFGFEVILKDDYRHRISSGPSSKRQFQITPRRIARQALTKVGIVADESMKKPKLWAYSVRGHYFGNRISYNDIFTLFVLAKQIGYLKDFKETSKSHTFIHYRLGDLLQLPEKGPISASRYFLALKQLSAKGLGPTLLSSDSLEEAYSRLSTMVPDIRCVPTDSNAWEFLNFAIAAKVFIGSNSKLTLWAFIFRCLDGNFGDNYMPLEFRTWIEKKLPDELLVSTTIHYF